jgi:hypothetical protein
MKPFAFWMKRRPHGSNPATHSGLVFGFWVMGFGSPLNAFTRSPLVLERSDENLRSAMSTHETMIHA